MKLHRVRHPGTGRNKYCGPSLVSALAGVDTATAARAIRTGRYGHQAIKGTDGYDLQVALGRFNISLWPIAGIAEVEFAARRHFSVAAFLSLWQRCGMLRHHVWVVSTGRHWIAVSGRRYVCGLTRRVATFRHRRVLLRSPVKEMYLAISKDRTDAA